MDGDPAVESELDSFSLTFPLPYRVGFIVVLAVWGWGINLHVLHNHKIDVPQLIHYPARASLAHPPHYLSTYRLASVLSILLGISLCAFWLTTGRDPVRVVALDWLPLMLLVAVVAVFVAPLRGLSSGGRRRFLTSLLRVSVGGLAETRDGKFGDILLADVLTSYAKVLCDLYVILCMFARSGGSATRRPDRECGGAVIVPLILAAPSAIRLRQCLIEYSRVRRAPYRESTGWGGQHLANAAKYASAFPVIALSALQRSLPDGGVGGEASRSYNRAWLAAVLLNSLYSFYWDVAKDWDLTLFSRSRTRAGPDHLYGLRRRLIFRPVAIYYVVIAADLILRCTWSLKLSPHLDRLSDFESSMFVLQLLEVIRRWVWIFLRVEAEWLRAGASAATTPPALDADGIPLPDYMYLGKYEDDDQEVSFPGAGRGGSG